MCPGKSKWQIPRRLFWGIGFQEKLESLPKTPLLYFPFPELKQRFSLVHVFRWESVSLNPLPRFLRALGVLDVNSFGADTLVALTGEECWDMGRVCRKNCHYGTIDAGWSWWNICLISWRSCRASPRWNKCFWTSDKFLCLIYFWPMFFSFEADSVIGVSASITRVTGESPEDFKWTGLRA